MIGEKKLFRTKMTKKFVLLKAHAHYKYNEENIS